MVLKRKYLHAYPHLPAIPHGKLITGVLLGLLFAFSFYSFLYVCREALRLLFFLTDERDILVLSDHGLSIANLILAYIAIIMGQSLCFAYWLDTPMGKFGKYGFRIRAIVNDQRGMNSYFISWFSRLAYTFPLLLGSTKMGGIYVAESFSGYVYMLALIIVVLFLHTWINIRRLFNGKSLRWMLVSAALLSVLSFGMSRINLIDYKGLNEVILSNNVRHTHRMQLPEARYYEPMNREWQRRATLTVAEDKSKPAGAEPVIYVGHAGIRGFNIRKVVLLENLKDSFIRWDQKMRGEQMAEPCILYIHRDIKMEYVSKLKKALAEVQACRMQYAVLPPVREYDDRYYTYQVLPLVTGAYYADAGAQQEIEKKLSAAGAVFDLHTGKDGGIVLDNAPVGRDSFKNLIYRKIQSAPADYYLKYRIDDSSSYADYIFIVSNIMQAIHELRDQYALEVYGTTYENLEQEAEQEVRGKFPYRVVEWIASE